jgi:DNA-binding NtrC family response regulator
MQGSKILIVDDSDVARTRLKEGLSDAGAVVQTVASARDALALLPRWPADLVVSGLQWEVGSMALCAGIRAAERPPAFMMLSPRLEAPAPGDKDLCAPRHAEGAALSAAVVRAHEALVLSAARPPRVPFLAPDVVRFHGMLGCGADMRVLIERLVRAARVDVPVLLSGPSGTGKELAARAIHGESARRDGPFVAVNCGGVPESLWESEFFGYAAGAFSGANRSREGLFAAAHGGTLFLDEIGEMPLGAQAKLLRVLEGGWMRPVGAVREHQVDVRIVAATHRNLALAAEQGRFRDDLLYRLDVLAVSLPGLAGRCDDITVLARHFLRACRVERGGAADGFEAEALAILRGYAFPGNVRELRNIIQSAAVFARGPRIGALDLPERVRRPGGRGPGASARAALPEPAGTGDLVTLEECKRAYVREVLRRVRGNKRAAARILGIERRTLYRWLTPS